MGRGGSSRASILDRDAHEASPTSYVMRGKGKAIAIAGHPEQVVVQVSRLLRQSISALSKKYVWCSTGGEVS